MLWKSLSQNIPLPLYMDFFLRILVASLCGAIIGVERSWRLKEAGVRTHLLVSCTAALIIIVSAVILAIQVIMHRMPVHNDQYQNSHIDITVHDDAGFRSALTAQLHDWQAQVIESIVTRNQDGTTSYSMELKMNTDVDPQSIYDFLEQNSSVLSFRQTTNN